MHDTGMRWTGAGLLLAFLFGTCPVIAQKKTAEKDSEKNTDKTVKAGTVVGKVQAVYEDKKRLRVQVTFHYQVLDQGQVTNLANAQRDLMLARDRNAAMQAQDRVLQAKLRLYRTESKTKDFEFQANDEVVVRTARPKDSFDGKGRPKKFTKAELAELKGPDKKLPGYTAEFGDIATEQIIQIHLVRKKGAPTTIRPKKGKAKDEAAEMDLLADFEPKASMIVILQEAAPK